MKQKTKWQQRGQSLVEVAVFLPVALIIIAGLVEFSLFLVTQNKVNTVSREAARFGANGGQNEGMVSVAMNTVTQTLQLEIDRWDLWTVRGRVRARCLNGTNGSATLDFGENNQDFVIEHSYGISQTVAFTETNAYIYDNTPNSGLHHEVLQQLSEGGVGNCANVNNPAPEINGLRFVGMYSAHDVDSILGLDVFLESVFTVRALHVFRVTSVVSNDQTRGCDAFPIALDERLRSVTAAEYNVALNTLPVSQRYPTTLPSYASFVQDGHEHGHSLADQAQEGDVFLYVGEGLDVLNYAWLQWNTDNTCPGCNTGQIKLQNSLLWPGDSLDPDLGFHEVGDWEDTNLNIGDRVAYNEAEGTAVESQIAAHIDRNRTLRLLLWQETGTLPGGGPGNSNVDYIRVSQFANMRLLGLHFQGGPPQRWLLVQFVNYDRSCGQVAATP